MAAVGLAFGLNLLPRQRLSFAVIPQVAAIHPPLPWRPCHDSVKVAAQVIQLCRRHHIPVGDDVKASVIARDTPGFSGADLANLVNEAALFAARGNNRVVGMEEFEKEPAYKRLGIDISENTNASNTSRMSLGTDSNDDVQLRSNNSFLHDNVD